MAKKRPDFAKCVFSWPTHFKNGHEMANLATCSVQLRSLLLYYQSRNCQTATHAPQYCLWRNKQNSFHYVITVDDL